MATRHHSTSARSNEDQVPLERLPIPPHSQDDPQLLSVMDGIAERLQQRNLNNAVHLAIEAAQGRGILMNYFAEMGRRFGTHTAPQEKTAAMLPFSFEGHAIRVIGQNDEPWWVLTDVCEVLGIRNSRDAVTRLDTDEKADVGITDTSSNGVTQRRKVTIINESGLWSLVLTSRKASARRFKKWLTSEVIPTIRKTGSYTLTHKAPAHPAPAPSPAPKSRKARRRPDVLFRLLKQIALDAGKSEDEAIKAAGHGVMKETGVDVMGLIGMG